VSETARRLDLARSQLYKLINAFGIERTDGGRPPLDSVRVE